MFCGSVLFLNVLLTWLETAAVISHWSGKQEVVKEVEVCSGWIDGAWVVTMAKWGELETEHDTTEASSYTQIEEEEEETREKRSTVGLRKEETGTFSVGFPLFLSPAVSSDDQPAGR